MIWPYGLGWINGFLAKIKQQHGKILLRLLNNPYNNASNKTNGIKPDKQYQADKSETSLYSSIDPVCQDELLRTHQEWCHPMMANKGGHSPLSRRRWVEDFGTGKGIPMVEGELSIGNFSSTLSGGHVTLRPQVFASSVNFL